MTHRKKISSLNLNSFPYKVKLWSDNAVFDTTTDWEEQIRMLSAMSDLITADVPIEEVIATIYASINQLMDAYQFAVGIYNAEERTILFKGMITNSQIHPDLVVDAFQDNRFAPWCILHKSEIFINDMENEYSRYVRTIPKPFFGPPPQAAIYVPLFLKDEIAGVITVRTINKHVYHKHHIYILKTLGNFVIKSFTLAQERAGAASTSTPEYKKWHWNEESKLPDKAKHTLISLTEREKEVILLMVSGLSNKAIAEKLFVSPSTIKTHTLNIYNKMDVGNRTSAIMKAIEMEWLVGG